MLSLNKARIAAMALCGVVLVACGDEGGDTESPINPVFRPDTGVSTVVDSGAPVMAAPDSGAVTAPRDSGMPVVTRMDSGQQAVVDSGVAPATDSAVADSGAATTPEGGTASDAATPSGDGGGGAGKCCPDGNCLCHGDAPSSFSGIQTRGPYQTMSYAVSGRGCVYYPTNAEPPFAAVAVSDGFLGAGGCGANQTNGWGTLYASWGIVAMIVNTGTLDQPNQRGTALTQGIAAFKAENTRSGSPLNGKLSGRYGTSGFSMGGGGTTFASADDASLKTSVLIMPYGPTREAVTVPSLVICGSSDSVAPCSSHGTPFYGRLADSVQKMRVTVSSSHVGQPSAGSNQSGRWGLAFQKVFLEGDTRWRAALVGSNPTATNIR